MSGRKMHGMPFASFNASKILCDLSSLLPLLCWA